MARRNNDDFSHIPSGTGLHRGAQGAAGDVGHVAITDESTVVCRCGNVGCLEAVYRRSLPLATRELRVMRSGLSDDAGLTGAAFMVIDELFSRSRLGMWIDEAAPVGRPELADVAG
jgi:hypothetical protein